MLDLKVVCAWCSLTIREGIQPTSHGICPKCSKELEGQLELLVEIQHDIHPEVADEDDGN